MKKLNTLALALICALPFAASAQTPSGMDKAPPSVKPANTPTTEMERKSGADTMSRDTTNKSKPKRKATRKDDTSTAPATGDVPSYPAKTKDGRPTSDLTTK